MTLLQSMATTHRQYCAALPSAGDWVHLNTKRLRTYPMLQISTALPS